MARVRFLCITEVGFAHTPEVNTVRLYGCWSFFTAAFYFLQGCGASQDLRINPWVWEEVGIWCLDRLRGVWPGGGLADGNSEVVHA